VYGLAQCVYWPSSNGECSPIGQCGAPSPRRLRVAAMLDGCIPPAPTVTSVPSTRSAVMHKAAPSTVTTCATLVPRLRGGGVLAQAIGPGQSSSLLHSGSCK
jgi:hypothetical protein